MMENDPFPIQTTPNDSAPLCETMAGGVLVVTWKVTSVEESSGWFLLMCVTVSEDPFRIHIYRLSIMSTTIHTWAHSPAPTTHPNTIWIKYALLASWPLPVEKVGASRKTSLERSLLDSTYS